MYYELTDAFTVAAPIDRTWAFFSDAGNLRRITPPWLGFQSKDAAPVTMENGTLLNYTIRWNKVPIRWRTKIIEWTPPSRFIDLQVRGPYALWLHQHTFIPSEDGTRCTDRVIYRIPVPGVGRVVHKLFVRRQLLEIFRFRREVIGKKLGWVRTDQPDVKVQQL